MAHADSLDRFFNARIKGNSIAAFCRFLTTSLETITRSQSQRASYFRTCLLQIRKHCVEIANQVSLTHDNEWKSDLNNPEPAA